MFKAIIETVTKDTYYEMEYERVEKIELYDEDEMKLLSTVYNTYYRKNGTIKIKIEDAEALD